jgi:DNA-binding HxlR family transcriptional regulator
MTSVTKHLPGFPIERTLGVIAGRWKAVLIYVLMSGDKRICDLEKQIPGLSQKVLIQQLRALEEHGLISRQLFADEPQRVDYRLTPLGRSLEPLISMLHEWGQQHAHELGEGERLLPCSLLEPTAPSASAG